MPVRATKRGAERTPFPSGASYDVVICGASFAGLAVARELRASRARVLVLDRYEIGEKQTSACCAPTEWIVNLGLEASIRQTFDSMVLHTMGAGRALAAALHVLDLRLPRAVRADVGAVRRSGVRDRQGATAARATSSTRTAATSAPGCSSTPGLAARAGRGHDPAAGGDALARPGGPSRTVGARPAAVGRPALRAGGLRLVVPRGRRAADRDRLLRPPLPRQGADRAARRDEGADTVRYQGNWIPHRLRPAVEDGVFFAGDSAGHCIADERRGDPHGLYFGIACGRELAAVLDGRAHREEALARYRAFSRGPPWKFEWMWLNQRSVRHSTAGRSTGWRASRAPRHHALALPPVPERRAARLRPARAPALLPARTRSRRSSHVPKELPHDRRRAPSRRAAAFARPTAGSSSSSSASRSSWSSSTRRS